MFLRPSRPEWRLKVRQHLLYGVQILPFSRPGSRVSTEHSRRFIFGYPLTSSGRSHGSVSVEEGVFDMEV